jgi:hypothetical protein
MKYLLSVTAISLQLLLFGCNPARRIVMKNMSGDTAQVIWKIQEDSSGQNPFNLSNNQELKFRLPPRGKGSTIALSFGVGTWSPSELELMISKVESLEIISARRVVRIDSLPLLKDFLLARRKGVGGLKIQILIAE